MDFTRVTTTATTDATGPTSTAAPEPTSTATATTLAAEMISRREAAARMGVTEGRIRQLERAGYLLGVRGTDGKYTVRADDVAAYAAQRKPQGLAHGPSKKLRTSGDIAAAVFALFKTGIQDVAEIVQRLHIDPQTVDRLWADWSCRDLDDRLRQHQADKFTGETERMGADNRQYNERLVGSMAKMFEAKKK